MNPTFSNFGPSQIPAGFFEMLQAHGAKIVVISDPSELFGSSSSSSIHLDRDRIIVGQFAEEVVGGFLNLGEREGWSEGSDMRVGASFTRCMLKEYVKKANPSNTNAEVIAKVIESFSNIGDFETAPFRKEPEDGHQPKSNRIRYDAGVTGWQKHAVTRMVGNIASKYNPDLPFFEVLINSARNSKDNEICNPFVVTIYDNEKELDARRKTLASLKMCPAQLAHFSFYASYLKGPEKFMETTKLKIGPNATRIFEGLIFLQNIELKAQSVGNCWIKQPMRSLLVSLYLEMLTERKELTPEGAWKEAVVLYKDIQKKGGIPLIEELLEEAKVSGVKNAYATAAIEERSLI